MTIAVFFCNLTKRTNIKLCGQSVGLVMLSVVVHNYRWVREG